MGRVVGARRPNRPLAKVTAEQRVRRSIKFGHRRDGGFRRQRRNPRHPIIIGRRREKPLRSRSPRPSPLTERSRPPPKRLLRRRRPRHQRILLQSREIRLVRVPFRLSHGAEIAAEPWQWRVEQRLHPSVKLHLRIERNRLSSPPRCLLNVAIPHATPSVLLPRHGDGWSGTVDRTILRRATGRAVKLEAVKRRTPILGNFHRNVFGILSSSMGYVDRQTIHGTCELIC